MKALSKFLLVVVFILGLIPYSKGQTAQTDSLPATHVKPFFLNAGLRYLSSLTYAGRREESSVPILMPGITLISKKGFFLNGTGYFNSSSGNFSAEGLSITPGYVFAIDEKRQFQGALSATKYFIEANSPLILSAFNASFDGELSYNPKFIKAVAGLSYRLGKESTEDFVNNFELSHEISVFTESNGKDGLKVTPNIALYTGTQSFYETYYTQSTVPRAVDNPITSGPLGVLFPGQPKQTIINETVTEEKQREVKKYDLLALSGNVSLEYTLGKFQVSFIPYVIRPFNQVNYIDDSAEGKTYFMFVGGLSATF